MNIIVPAHNEEKRLKFCVETLVNLYPKDSVTISTDGNRDGTDHIAYELSKRYQNVSFMANSFRLGKGAAIKRALKDGQMNAFVDVDLSTSPVFLESMKRIVEVTDGLVVAKRFHAKRGWNRALQSWMYRTLVNRFFHLDIHDFQCGCKVLSSEASRIAMKCRLDGFGFDTELIIRCLDQGLTVIEYPVMWVESGHSSVSMLDGFGMIKELFNLRRST